MGDDLMAPLSLFSQNGNITAVACNVVAVVVVVVDAVVTGIALTKWEHNCCSRNGCCHCC